MARLKVPALYELKVGSSTWSWHKMSDLTEAVNNILDRSPLPSMEPAFILSQFTCLNGKALFYWSDEKDLHEHDPNLPLQPQPNMFVPAQWGMKVLREVKKLIKQKTFVPA